MRPIDNRRDEPDRDAPTSARDERWTNLWDALEREAARPQKGFEPDLADPATPEANPEIGEWVERQLIDERELERERAARTARDPRPQRSGVGKTVLDRPRALGQTITQMLSGG